MKAPCEWWVFLNSNCYGDVGDYATKGGEKLEHIHVIEKSAYDELAELLKSALDELALARKRYQELVEKMAEERTSYKHEIEALRDAIDACPEMGGFGDDVYKWTAVANEIRDKREQERE